MEALTNLLKMESIRPLVLRTSGLEPEAKILTIENTPRPPRIFKAPPQVAPRTGTQLMPHVPHTSWPGIHAQLGA